MNIMIQISSNYGGGGRGSKNPNILRMSLMDAPLLLLHFLWAIFPERGVVVRISVFPPRHICFSSTLREMGPP